MINLLKRSMSHYTRSTYSSKSWKSEHNSPLSNLINDLKREHIIKSPEVEKVMLTVDRKDFCVNKYNAYDDSPQSIGSGQTISAPHMHALSLELLQHFVSRKNARVLDVGSGSGYLTACLGKMVGKGGRVIGIDVVEDLIMFSKKNIERSYPELNDVVKIEYRNGWEGCEEEGPFDAIHVGAAASEIPQPLLDQLKENGRMIIPVGKYSQSFLQIDKNMDGTLEKKTLLNVMYVPLVKDESEL